MYVSDTLLAGIIWLIKASVFLGSFNLNYSAHFQCAWMQIAKDPKTLTLLRYLHSPADAEGCWHPDTIHIEHS